MRKGGCSSPAGMVGGSGQVWNTPWSAAPRLATTRLMGPSSFPLRSLTGPGWDSTIPSVVPGQPAFPTFMLRTLRLSMGDRSAHPVPSYTGFDGIDALRDRFLIVGDTQSTSRWEFWRERNSRERQALLGEMLRRDPAFVLHLGDLTTRGSSSRHWRAFDELFAPFRQRKIPYFPILGNHEFYGNDRVALRHYF